MKKITTLIVALTFVVGLSYLAIAADESAMGDKMMGKDAATQGEDMMDSMSDLEDETASMINNEIVNDEYDFEDEDIDSIPAAVPASK